MIFIVEEGDNGGVRLRPSLEQVTLLDKVGLWKRLSELGISGGAVYDALSLQAAIKAGADRIVTLNEGDFRRAAPDLADRIVSP